MAKKRDKVRRRKNKRGRLSRRKNPTRIDESRKPSPSKKRTRKKIKKKSQTSETHHDDKNGEEYSKKRGKGTVSEEDVKKSREKALEYLTSSKKMEKPKAENFLKDYERKAAGVYEESVQEQEDRIPEEVDFSTKTEADLPLEFQNGTEEYTILSSMDETEWQTYLDEMAKNGIQVDYVMQHDMFVVKGGTGQATMESLQSEKLPSVDEFIKQQKKANEQEEEGGGTDDPDKIDSEDEFRDYAEEILKEAHGDDYDPEMAEEIIQGLIDRVNDPEDELEDWGDAVGALQSSMD